MFTFGELVIDEIMMGAGHEKGMILKAKTEDDEIRWLVTPFEDGKTFDAAIFGKEDIPIGNDLYVCEEVDAAESLAERLGFGDEVFFFTKNEDGKFETLEH